MSHEESDETVAASKLTSARAKRTLVFPRCLSNSNFPENITNKDEDQFQVSVHQCSRAMQRDMKEFFHHLSDEQLAELKIITTCQKSLVDLVEWGNDQAKEKDRLLEKFLWWAKEIEKVLKGSNPGQFVDIMDPCTGQPIHTSTNSIFAEIDAIQVILGYNITDIGTCKLLLHPKWGTGVYPASMFTTASAHEIVSAMEKVTGDTVEVHQQ